MLCLLCLVPIVSGCVKDYRKLSRGKSTVLKSYSPNDTLVVSDYIFYNTRTHLSFGAENEPMEMNSDSVMQILVASFKNLGAPIQDRLELGKNHIDSTFIKKYVVRTRRVNSDWIKEVAGQSKGTYKLIPFLYILNRIAFTGYITSGGMSGSNGFYLVTYLNLIVYIVHENEIVYSSQALHTSELMRTDTRREAEALPSAIMITEENWQELARISMEDYFKRWK
ncbi:hypothetical protein ADIS_3267 [Lunatimonas lonarensis]|uniref:Lipoprotein n=1 Tax=Lunatimonas lonarensis TaxID=1232681 RepID=R7ZQ58_9BACT|nr:hypothetical protein ADIS_3267 [Lunatimonas lonarensis]